MCKLIIILSKYDAKIIVEFRGRSASRTISNQISYYLKLEGIRL
jgi:hypothetical protein